MNKNNPTNIRATKANMIVVGIMSRIIATITAATSVVKIPIADLTESFKAIMTSTCHVTVFCI